MTANESGIQTTAEPEGRWRVVAHRVHAGRAADGEVIANAPLGAEPDAPVARLAAGRAWLALGQAWLPDDAAAALACGREGVRELGERYAPRGVEDDTDLKLLAADGLEKDGRIADAAALTLRMLESRLGLMTRRHQSEIAR